MLNKNYKQAVFVANFIPKFCAECGTPTKAEATVGDQSGRCDTCGAMWQRTTDVALFDAALQAQRGDLHLFWTPEGRNRE